MAPLSRLALGVCGLSDFTTQPSTRRVKLPPAPLSPQAMNQRRVLFDWQERSGNKRQSQNRVDAEALEGGTVPQTEEERLVDVNNARTRDQPRAHRCDQEQMMGVAPLCIGWQAAGEEEEVG
ncbi:hypothetical protein NHX12_009733 [Muraenolepis orangiensis]|uniref:Uncharacterized protein n=1 Tax=Muraenolepis orangiensis TaxID=630683 RepID=A0A9Q0I7Q3_9TELE|nr:hypothetical protein NHX12_009733 [Muraenolepis orangiensis]